MVPSIPAASAWRTRPSRSTTTRVGNWVAPADWVRFVVSWIVGIGVLRPRKYWAAGWVSELIARTFSLGCDCRARLPRPIIASFEAAPEARVKTKTVRIELLKRPPRGLSDPLGSTDPTFIRPLVTTGTCRSPGLIVNSNALALGLGSRLTIVKTAL